MYRRRRPTREKIHFSFDSFLDVVANVIGIIIRLILVAWVGARSYSAALQWVEETSQAEVTHLPPPNVTEDPLHAELNRAQAELEESRRRLVEHMGKLDLAKQKAQVTQRDLNELARKRQELENQQKAVEGEFAGKGRKIQLASLSVEELRKRGKALADQIKELQALPSPRKVLRYHTPVSRVVDGDELFLECRGGKVAFIDMAAFLHEIRQDIESIGDLMRKQAKVVRNTNTVGAFRLRYTFERSGGLFESSSSGFSYGLSEWVVEPVGPLRGETLEAALAANSDFRRVAEAIDPNQSVVTFWVYPDSFELFRRLRDYLFERGIEVAGRPLPAEAPIAGSRSGSRSRGQ